MRFYCPNCDKHGNIDDDKIRTEGIFATCPRCKTRFLVHHEQEFIFEEAPQSGEVPKPINLKGMPWRRFWARHFDLNMFSIPWWVAFYCIFPKSDPNDWMIHWMAILPLTLATEALVIASCCTTPGKWLLGMSVIRKDGKGKVPLADALRRGGLVWAQGLACGFPLLPILTMPIAALKTKKDGTAHGTSH